MKKLFGFFTAILLSLNSIAFSQGTQINGTQIKDGTITDAKIAGNAAISYTKLNLAGFTPSIINAENPLTFNTPLVRTSNAIELTVVPVTLGGTGLTTIVAGRVLFGNSSSQAATSANFTFDTGTNAFTITGSGHFTTSLVVGGTLSINGKVYAWPADYVAGAFLKDAAGNGTLSWVVPSAVTGFVTLQGSDPGTPNTGGLNISANGYVGGSLKSNTSSSSSIVVTSIAAPGAPSVTPVGAGGAVTWTYVVVANLVDGSTTEASGVGTTGVGSAVLNGTDYNTVTWSAVTGAASYDVYRTVAGTTPSTTGKITATPTVLLTLDDKALADDGNPAPITNGTGIVSATSFATTAGPTWTTGSGSPAGSCVTGSLYTDTAGGAGTTLYVCETASWAAK